MRQLLTESYLASLKKRDVIAFDVATRTGFYSVHGYGTRHFPNTEDAPKRLGDDYQQHKAFRDWVIGLIQEHGFKLVVAEDVQVSKSFKALRKLAQFQGVLMECCATMNIPILLVGVTHLKKFACNKGTASKEEMMQAAKDRWHIDVEGDDNAGDAAHLYFYTIKKYRLQ